MCDMTNPSWFVVYMISLVGYGVARDKLFKSVVIWFAALECEIQTWWELSMEPWWGTNGTYEITCMKWIHRIWWSLNIRSNLMMRISINETTLRRCIVYEFVGISKMVVLAIDLTTSINRSISKSASISKMIILATNLIGLHWRVKWLIKLTLVLVIERFIPTRWRVTTRFSKFICISNQCKKHKINRNFLNHSFLNK